MTTRNPYKHAPETLEFYPGEGEECTLCPACAAAAPANANEEEGEGDAEDHHAGDGGDSEESIGAGPIPF